MSHTAIIVAIVLVAVVAYARAPRFSEETAPIIGRAGDSASSEIGITGAVCPGSR